MVKKCKIEKGIVFGIMLLSAAVRLIGLSGLPAGVLPDEAYGAYNAWGLMTEGMDSRGYSYPVYFVAWGSGMSVLYSYVAVPLFRVFGSNILVYRLPQALLGIVSVYAFYRLIAELWDERLGCLAAFALSVNPWHIMNTRFGLDANMAPGMFLLGTLFFALSLRKKRSDLLPAAMAFGATLYCYAMTWLIVPMFLLLCVLFFWRQLFGRENSVKNKILFLSFALLLFILALPLLLFVAVNIGMMEEVKNFLFSIPRLSGFRKEELSVAHVWESMKALKDILLSQYDGVSYTSSRVVGAYYLFTSPFIVFGLFCQIVSLYRWLRGKKEGNSLQYLMLFWTLSAVAVCSLNQNITIIHTNMLHIPAVFYGVYGIVRLKESLQLKYLLPACLGFWIFSFGVFLKDYIMTPSGYFVDQRAEAALERAEEISEGTITIFDYTIIKYSCLLWWQKPAVSDYAENAVYEGDAAWAELAAYGKYRYISRLEDVTEGGVYILHTGCWEEFADMGFRVEPVNDLYCIAY